MRTASAAVAPRTFPGTAAARRLIAVVATCAAAVLAFPHPIAAQTPDPPSLQSARAEQGQVVLTFDAALDEASEPDPSAFTVTVRGAASAVSAVDISGSVVTLTLDEPLTVRSVPTTLAYSPPAAGALRNSDGVNAARFTGFAVEPAELWIAHGSSDLHSVLLDDEHVLLHSGDGPATVDAYHLDTGALSSPRGYTLASAGRTRSLWTDGTTLWAAAADRETDGRMRADPGLVAYSLASGSRSDTKDVCITGHRYPIAPATRPVPIGVASDGTTFWVSLEGSRTLYAHRLRGGVALRERNINVADNNDEPHGLFVRGRTLWALSPDDSKAFAYDTQTGAPKPSLDIDLSRRHQGSDLQPVDLWSDGKLIAVAYDDHTNSNGDGVLIAAAPTALAGGTTTTRATGSPGGDRGGGGGGGGRDDKDSTATVVIVNGWSAPDIGVAAVLSARTDNSAVLYTSGDRLSAAAADLLSDYRPMRIFVVGGTAAVGPATSAAVDRLAREDAVTRIAGTTRIATSAAVARRTLGAPAAASVRPTVIVANGWSPPDIGLAAALSARIAGSAVLYTVASELPADAQAVLRDYQPAWVLIVGGHSAVSPAVEAAITAAATSARVERHAGATRTHTAAATARHILGEPTALTEQPTFILANGWSPPDIGVAAALAARTPGSAVVYTEAGQLPEEVSQLLRDYQSARISIVGGPAAISPSVQAAASATSPDARISRTSGATRTQTAANIARRILGRPETATP